jgi:hypothetical protein
MLRQVYEEAMRRGASAKVAHDVSVSVIDRGAFAAFMAGNDADVLFGTSPRNPDWTYRDAPAHDVSAPGLRLDDAADWREARTPPHAIAGYGVSHGPPAFRPVAPQRAQGTFLGDAVPFPPHDDHDRLIQALEAVSPRPAQQGGPVSWAVDGGVLAEGRRPDWGHLQWLTPPGMTRVSNYQWEPPARTPAPPPSVQPGPVPVDGQESIGPGPNEIPTLGVDIFNTPSPERVAEVHGLFMQAKAAAERRGASPSQVLDILSELGVRAGGGTAPGHRAGFDAGYMFPRSGEFDRAPLDQFIEGLGMDLIYSLRAGEEGGPLLPGATPAPAGDPPRFPDRGDAFRVAAEEVEKLGLAGDQRDALARMTGHEWESLRRALERGQGAFNLAIDTTTMGERMRALDAAAAAAAWGGGSRGAGAYESELAEIMRRFAEQDEQARIDEINRLAIEQKRWEDQFAFEQAQWEQQYALERLVYDLQAAEAERRMIESMSTPFASLMGQFQMRAPDEPVTLTPGVGALLRGRGIPVSGGIPGEPVTVTANQITAGSGQILRDLMANMGAREYQGAITDPMEAAQLQTLAEVGGMGRLAYMQGLANRVIAERPVGPSRFA